MTLALLVGGAVLLASLLSYAVTTAFLIHGVVWLIRLGYTGRSFWKNVAVVILASLVTAAAHLVHVALWAIAFLLIGEISTFEKAFYFSAQNYTSLGYGDIVLSERWRLLGPLEAINGLLLVGLSTAMLFALMSHLIASHLRLQLGEDDLMTRAMSPQPIAPDKRS
jgi:hypothetical protein